MALAEDGHEGQAHDVGLALDHGLDVGGDLVELLLNGGRVDALVGLGYGSGFLRVSRICTSLAPGVHLCTGSRAFCSLRFRHVNSPHRRRPRSDTGHARRRRQAALVALTDSPDVDRWAPPFRCRSVSGAYLSPSRLGPGAGPNRYPPLLTLIVGSVNVAGACSSSLNRRTPTRARPRVRMSARMPPADDNTPPPSTQTFQLGLTNSGVLWCGRRQRHRARKTPKVAARPGCNPSTRSAASVIRLGKPRTRCRRVRRVLPGRQTSATPTRASLARRSASSSTTTGTSATSAQPGHENRPTNTLVDLFSEPKSDEHQIECKAHPGRGISNDRPALRAPRPLLYFGPNAGSVTPETPALRMRPTSTTRRHPFDAQLRAVQRRRQRLPRRHVRKRVSSTSARSSGRTPRLLPDLPKLIWGFLPRR